jgi:hypothetical protein
MDQCPMSMRVKQGSCPPVRRRSVVMKYSAVGAADVFGQRRGDAATGNLWNRDEQDQWLECQLGVSGAQERRNGVGWYHL